MLWCSAVFKCVSFLARKKIFGVQNSHNFDKIQSGV